MVGDRRGGRHDPSDLRPDQKEHEHPYETCPPADFSSEGTPSSRAHRRPGEAAARLRVYITAPRVGIDHENKGARYTHSLERRIRELNRNIANPEGYEKIQLKAMETYNGVAKPLQYASSFSVA